MKYELLYFTIIYPDKPARSDQFPIAKAITACWDSYRVVSWTKPNHVEPSAFLVCSPQFEHQDFKPYMVYDMCLFYSMCIHITYPCFFYHRHIIWEDSQFLPFRRRFVLSKFQRFTNSLPQICLMQMLAMLKCHRHRHWRGLVPWANRFCSLKFCKETFGKGRNYRPKKMFKGNALGHCQMQHWRRRRMYPSIIFGKDSK